MHSHYALPNIAFWRDVTDVWRCAQWAKLKRIENRITYPDPKYELENAALAPRFTLGFSRKSGFGFAERYTSRVLCRKVTLQVNHQNNQVS